MHLNGFEERSCSDAQADSQERKANFKEVAMGTPKKSALSEAQRCLQCKVAPCSKGCPVEMCIPEFIKLIKEHKFSDAAMKIREKQLYQPSADALAYTRGTVPSKMHRGQNR